MAKRQWFSATFSLTLLLLFIHLVTIQRQLIQNDAQSNHRAAIQGEISRQSQKGQYRVLDADKHHQTMDRVQSRHLQMDNAIEDHVTKMEYEPETDLNDKPYQLHSILKIPQVNISDLDLSAPMNCSKLAHGDKVEQIRVLEKLKHMNNPPMTSEKYIQLSRNCSDFRISRGYDLRQPSEVETKFPLAFSIRFYHDIEMAERLLRAIYMPHNIYCIYIDKKASQLIHKAMKSITNCLPNVFIASRLYTFTYGSFSPVEADLQCMSDLVASSQSWKYFLNVAGTEFPLKTNLEIVEVLKRLNGYNDIEQYPMWDIHQNRINQTYVMSRNFQKVIPTHIKKESFHENITIMKGCSYNAFSRPFVEWVLTDDLANQFIDWSRDTYSPDETVWATLNALPAAPGGYQFRIAQESKLFLSREVLWTRSALKCKGLYQRGICLLGMHELPFLTQSNQLFANKFDIHEDPVAYECLEEMHQQRTVTRTVNIKWLELKRLPHLQCEGKTQLVQN